MSVDLRTRVDGALDALEPASILDATLPAAFERAGALLAPAVAHLGPAPLTLAVGSEHWTLRRRGTRIVVDRGAHQTARQLRLDPMQLSELVRDQVTPNGWFTRGTLSSNVPLTDLFDWWLLLRGALDHVAPHVPGAIGFTEEDGSTLDLRRTFIRDDSVDGMHHFLEQTGFLRIRNVFTEHEMIEISDEMDRLSRVYSCTDRRSFWATASTGEARLVRMQYFDTISDRTAALIADPRLFRIARITGDRHEVNREAGLVEALIKPANIVERISDFPWHKDCSLGRHSYDCCSLTVGISVTAASAVRGQLRVIAGSHRASVWPVMIQPGLDLPSIDLPTNVGDVTVHLSCTLHMSQPPTVGERRVLYVGFRLPVVDQDAASAGRLRTGLRTTDLV